MSRPNPIDECGAVLKSSREYGALLDSLGEVEWLPVPASAWLCELLRADLNRPLLVVVPHESDALSWVEAVELVGGIAGHFAAPSLTPYLGSDISLQIRAAESVILHRIREATVPTVISTPRALFRPLPTPEAFDRLVVALEVDQEHPPEALADHLLSIGYKRTDLVTEPGEFATRGGVFDLFSPGLAVPVRLDLFGDRIESIRQFSPDDQRSLGTQEGVTILPLSLYPAGDRDAVALSRYLGDAVGRNLGSAGAEQLEMLTKTGRFPGWESYLPLLAAETTLLGSWLERPLVVALSPHLISQEIERHATQLSADHREAQKRGQVAVGPEELEHPRERIEHLVGEAEVRIGGLDGKALGKGIDFNCSRTDLFHGQLPRFQREVETARARGERLFLASPKEHWARLDGWCEQQGIPRGIDGVEFVDGELSRGFRLPPAGVVIYGERQLFPRVTPGGRRGRPKYGPFVSSLRDLRSGDYVVHTEHGIGQFVALRSIGEENRSTDGLPPGLEALRQESTPSDVEVMEIQYTGGRNLLLPLSRLDQIQRYSGIEGLSPKLDRLGGTSWTRTKARVRKSMQRLASDLVQLYAERQLATAPPMAESSDLMAQFEASFEYEETEDQQTAIRAVREDLERDRPMDRLLCGDVGFGKTEVAMRAAFKVAESGYQVALLAPTTILADQHLETFQKRLAGYPIRVEMISRRRSPATMRRIRDELASGELDILIGTHRLLGRDIQIPKLALLIVDEEQRFGVAQKERLRELKKNVHVLAMSATPVPRTLQLSLAGVRDLSVIETPPRDRMAVETAILPLSRELIREAVEFERDRQGQTYFVYNRVEGIEEFASFLREVIPDLSLTIGHGQMDENELARRMHAFKQGKYELLLATTIIENGIDIPNVNTIIVHQAERFGLAQLYQLRGRVGRSDQLAYCYLLVPGDRVLSREASQRLRALKEFTELGAGFRVAARDLEIRGAGNLLGPEQSGHIAAVGIETYLRMLEDTVRELKGEVVEKAASVAIDLPLPMALPEDYIGDANLRMDVYRRIASAEGSDEEIIAELRDRFGPPPAQVYDLIEVAGVKKLAETLRVQSISLRGAKILLRLRRDTRIDVDLLVRLVSEEEGLSFSPSGVLSVERDPGTKLGGQTRALLERLST